MQTRHFDAYRFETTVQANGVLQIPEMARFYDHQVEIIVMVKPQIKQTIQLRVEKFLDKWTGFLKDVDPDELKLQYLQEKYG